MMHSSELNFEHFLTLVEAALNRLVPSQKDPLLDAARYSLLGGGKRLRPLLLLATLVAYQGPIDPGIVPACALEMIHTYSLIHDDLPCMDDGMLRRAKPTLHRVVPEWHALLTGDYLLTYAFELLSTAPGLSDSTKVALIRTFASYAGQEGMIGGQIIDLLSEHAKISEERLSEMHQKKTSSLLCAALESGAIIAGASTQEISLLRQIGQKLGLAFQLVDDLLDVQSTSAVLGKVAGSDATHDKATAVSVLGIEKTEKLIEVLRTEIESLTNTLGCDTLLLRSLFHQLIHRHY